MPNIDLIYHLFYLYFFLYLYRYFISICIMMYHVVCLYLLARGTLAYITNLVDTLACTKSCLNQTYSHYTDSCSAVFSLHNSIS